MADVQTTINELKFEWAFADGDTRTFKIKNPRTGDLYNAIDELNTYILTNALLIGDKMSGAFTGIYRVKRVSQTKTALDIA